MEQKIFFIGLLLTLVFVLQGIDPVDPGAPVIPYTEIESIEISYNAEEQILTLYVAHPVEDPENQYIRLVTVRMDNPGSGNPPRPEGKLREEERIERRTLEIEERRGPGHLWEDEATIDSGYGATVGGDYEDVEAIPQEGDVIIVQHLNEQDDQDGVVLIYRIPSAKSGNVLNIIATNHRGQNEVKRYVID